MTDIAHGVWAAALTPLNADLSIDTSAYLTHLKRLLDGGCNGVAVLGTTGEANSFTVQERLALIEHVGAASLAPERVIIGTGCCAIPDTIALTRAAIAAGYPNMMMLPPFYYKPSEDGLFRAYAQIIEAVGDPRLRVIIYDFPQMTGFTISTALLRRLESTFKGVVVGVKNSSGDWPAMDATLKELPGFLVFAGSEQFLLPTLRAGGPGCISATANVTHAALAQLLAHWRDADADARQEAATRTRLAMQKFPTIAALKEIMAAKTGDAGWRRLRAPLINLTGADATRLIETARSLELLG
jgi:4-hydroxy-tetrahydrodipicolinate synthase